MADRFTAWKARRQQDTIAVPTSEPEGHEMAGLDGNGIPALYPERASIQDGIAQFNTNAAQLDALVAETRVLSHDLKQRIAALNSPAASPRDAQIRGIQAKLVSSKFIEAIQNYRRAEQQYQTKYTERVERQFKIVYPNASPEDVAAVVEEQRGGNQIFAQALALSSSTRYGDSRAAYREVQERHQDIRKMEQTLAELGQLCDDMETIIAQQELTIGSVMETAGKVEEQTDAARKATNDAAKFVISARKRRWMCFFLVVALLAVIALVLGLLFYYGKIFTSHHSNSITNNGTSHE